jgi:hypothetical protein
MQLPEGVLGQNLLFPNTNNEFIAESTTRAFQLRYRTGKIFDLDLKAVPATW